MAESSNIARLVAVMAKLRDPDGGCPWDLEQDFASIAPYTIEEAYEVADAIERGSMPALRDELGDLLLQVVFHARMAEEDGAFDFEDVAGAIAEKMIARHPHVFATEDIDSADAQTRAWEEQKAAERAASAAAEGRRPGALDGVALGLPALLRALKLQKRAARVGFDWDTAPPILAKIAEECAELAAEAENGGGPDRLEHELGDLLFAVTNLARHLDIEPEGALRAANRRFERRFGFIETRLEERGSSPEAASLEEMDALWDAAKREGL